MNKILVAYLGYQERPNKKPFLLVNEIETKTTVTYNEDIHLLVFGKQLSRLKHLQ